MSIFSRLHMHFCPIFVSLRSIGEFNMFGVNVKVCMQIFLIFKFIRICEAFTCTTQADIEIDDQEQFFMQTLMFVTLFD